MTFTQMLTLVCSMIAAILLFPLWIFDAWKKNAPQCNLVKENYRKDKIPTSAGVVIAVTAIVIILIAVFFHWETYYRFIPPFFDASNLPFLVILIGYTVLGLIDDLWGNGDYRGLKGHFNAVRDGKITTGVIKAVGGLALAFYITMGLVPKDPMDNLVGGLVIALCANVFNLLDLRPGRAISIFYVISVPLAVFCFRGNSEVSVNLGLLLLSAVLVMIADRNGKIMLGDSGANLLGAALGFALISVSSLWIQFILLALLVLLHMTAEKYSLSKIIEQNKTLKMLDRLTGVR